MSCYKQIQVISQSYTSHWRYIAFCARPTLTFTYCNKRIIGLDYTIGFKNKDHLLPLLQSVIILNGH